MLFPRFFTQILLIRFISDLSTEVNWFVKFHQKPRDADIFDRR